MASAPASSTTSADPGLDEVVGRPRRRRRPAGVAAADRDAIEVHDAAPAHPAEPRQRRHEQDPLAGHPLDGRQLVGPVAAEQRVDLVGPVVRRGAGDGRGALGGRRSASGAGIRCRRPPRRRRRRWAADGHRHRPERGRHLSGDLERSGASSATPTTRASRTSLPARLRSAPRPSGGRSFGWACAAPPLGRSGRVARPDRRGQPDAVTAWVSVSGERADLDGHQAEPELPTDALTAQGPATRAEHDAGDSAQARRADGTPERPRSGRA